MINKPNNWENVQAFGERAKLPVDGYVCKIKQVKVDQVGSGEQLLLAFDITEGEYAHFFDDDFRNNDRKDKKWKGILRQWLPKDDGSEKDEWTKSGLKGLITSIEESNPGYTWNWDERSLANKALGIIFRNEEWEKDGKGGWTARPFRACSVDTIHKGTFKIPDDKPLKGKTSGVTFTELLEADDTDLPF